MSRGPSSSAACIAAAALAAAAGHPLIDAVKNGDRAAVRALLAQKTDANAAEPDGTTALHHAVQRADSETVDLLIAAGADAKAINRYGISALHVAATIGSAPVIERLLQAGAPADGATSEGETALMAASPVQLRVGYLDLVSGRYRTAGNDDPSLQDVVLASCAIPLVFPPIPLRDGRELGVDGGVRSHTPLVDALQALFERAPAWGRDEVWVVLPHPVRRVTEARIRHWLSVARRCVALLTDGAVAEDVERARHITSLLRSAGNGDGRHDVRVRVLHPRARLDGSPLDFQPERVRTWYEDGLRTAREGDVLEL